MIKKILDYIQKKDSCNSSCTIRLSVDLSTEREISFRVDGENMRVEWGDHTATDVKYLTEQFTHEYATPGVFQLVIQGENITAIDMKNCHCCHLEVQECETLEFIDCSYNDLKALEVSRCRQLNELHCGNNQLETLELEGLSKLFYVFCPFNRLKTLSVKKCPKLVNLYCSHNDLQNLDLSSCRKLVVVKAENNLFDEAALLRFISTLKHKFNRTPGLLGINKNTERVSLSIAQKGWCKI